MPLGVGVGLGMTLGGGKPPVNYAARWGLVSYWNLEDTADAYGANTLTNFGSVPFVAGKIGNAVSVSSGKYMTRADDVTLRAGNVDHWIACWAYGTTFNAYNTIVTKRAAIASAALEYLLRCEGAVASFYVGNGAGLTAVAGSSLTANVWSLLLAWQDVAANTINLRVDNGSVATATRTITPAAQTDPFYIGGTSGNEPFTGLIDSVAFGKPATPIGALITEIHDTLYNGGAGKSWPL